MRTQKIFFVAPPHGIHYTLSGKKDAKTILRIIADSNISCLYIPSILMRSFMQLHIYQKYIPDNLELYVTTSIDVSNSLVILNKYLINDIDLIVHLRKKIILYCMMLLMVQ
jgi:hypothetical protein